MQATNHTSRAFLSIWLIFTLSACGTADLASGEALPPIRVLTELPAQSDADADTAAAGTSGDAALAADMAAFATDLYGVLGHKSGNVVFSPHAVAMALGMISLGAGGDTAQQMRTVLHWDAPGDMPARLAAWRESLANSASDPVTLGAANAVWAAPDLKPSAAYAAALQEGFGSGWRSVDMAQAPNAARENINDWVETQTQGLIPELLAPGQLDPASRMIVTSALSMTAPWEKPFPQQSTGDRAFYGTDGRESVVPMMRQKLRANFATTDAFRVLDLPYAGGSLHFTVLLPTGTHTVQQALAAQPLASIFAALQPRTVQLTMPRFKVSASYSLRQTLEALGMRDAFQAGDANFASIDGAGGLVLGDVVHQTVIDVTEAGTRAAAATGVSMMPTAVPADLVTLEINRPFLFVIRDTGSQSLLFLGRVERP